MSDAYRNAVKKVIGASGGIATFVPRPRPVSDGDLFDDGGGGVVMFIKGKYYDMSVDYDFVRVPDKDWKRIDIKKGE